MFDYERDDATRAAEQATGFAVAYATAWGNRMVRLRGRIAKPGCGSSLVDTFVACAGDPADAVTQYLAEDASGMRADADDVIAAAGEIEAMGDVEQRRILPWTPDHPVVRVSFVAPVAGTIEMDVDGKPIADRLRRIVRERREDSEGRLTPALCAMAMGLAADDEGDLRRIVDTVFSAGNVRYRGVRAHLKSGTDLVMAEHAVGQVTVSENGVDVRNLSDTVRTAIHGRTLEGTMLREVVDVPGFGDLRIRRVTRHGGPDNMRIEVADLDNANLPKVGVERAYAVALGVLKARKVS